MSDQKQPETQEIKFGFAAKVILELIQKGESASIEGVKFNLFPSENLNKSMYINENGLPTQEGSRVFTDVLVQGLIANIHMADQTQIRERTEHVQYILSELERGLSEVGELTVSTFDS